MIIKDEIYIEVPPEPVWKITLDIERWPEWTPTVEFVTRMDKGPLEPGSKVRLKQPMQPEAEWTVTKLEDYRLFAWETHRSGLHITAFHEIAADGDGTLNRLVVEIKGVLVILLWPVFKLAVRKALADENKGLKKRCESNGPF